MKRSIILVVILIGFLSSFAQNPYKNKNYIDTATTMVWTHANFSYQIPFGTGYLSNTFSNNFNIGTGFFLKNDKNWTYEYYFNYMFGSDVVLSDSLILGDMVNNNGDIIDENGLKATIYLEGRYWSTGFGIGKIFPIDNWKNSGIWVKANVGIFGHKIFITDPDNGVTSLDKETYRKGYDQKSLGFCSSQFIGYLFMHKKRVASFYAGIEITEIWSKPIRNYSFMLGASSELPVKFSGLASVKLGWIVPLYEKQKVVNFYKY